MLPLSAAGGTGIEPVLDAIARTARRRRRSRGRGRRRGPVATGRPSDPGDHRRDRLRRRPPARPGAARRAMTSAPSPAARCASARASTGSTARWTDRDSLERLVEGADAVIHVAGVINAPTRPASKRAMSPEPPPCSPPPRRPGSSASSMSARSPRASRSCRSTARARRGRRSWSKRPASPPPSSARPPSMVPATARRSSCSRWPGAGLVLLPPHGRLSVIHVDDLARLLLALADPECPAGPAGRARRRPRRAAGPMRNSARRSAGRWAAAVVTLSMPRSMLRLGARIDGLLRGDQRQADPRPRRLFLPSRLDGRAVARRAGSAVAADRSIPTRASPQPPAGTGRKAGSSEHSWIDHRDRRSRPCRRGTG